MGDVITVNAAADDILADIRSALARALARGGKWKQLAEERLAELVLLVDNVDARLAAAQKTAAPLQAAAEEENERADDRLGALYDELWNALGRPARDPALALLFPGGASFYADGSTADQPLRMTLLAELLESKLHPRLDPAAAQKWAAEVRAGAASLEQALEAARKPRHTVELLRRVRSAIARSCQAQLAAYKRALKAEGFSEAEVHEVIPTRPRARRPAAPAATG